MSNSGQELSPKDLSKSEMEWMKRTLLGGEKRDREGISVAPVDGRKKLSSGREES